ncbi:MAG: kelch repeat-containing protein [Candidatus Limnocylindrales bacterium]
MPTERLEMASAVVDGRVYLIGGLSETGATLTTVEVYDPGMDTWASGPEHPVPIHHPMAAVLDGVLYVAGGYGPSGAATRRVHRLGPEGWQAVARLPLARAAGTMVALGGRLLLAGGIDLAGDIGRELLVYEPATDAWSVSDGPPTPREHLGGAVADGRFLTVGGRAARQHLGTVEAWDPVTGGWEPLMDLPTPRAGLGAAATCDGGLVAIGGEDITSSAGRTFPEVEAWDPVSATWSSWVPLPEGRHGVGVVSVGSTVLVIGGGTTAGLSASGTVEALDISGAPGCGGTATPP